MGRSNMSSALGRTPPHNFARVAALVVDHWAQAGIVIGGGLHFLLCFGIDATRCIQDADQRSEDWSADERSATAPSCLIR